MPLKRARKARQDGVETREAILAAAEQEFADKGFELASAREICRRAKDEKSWRAAVREWVDDMLFMTLPTERAQKLCAGLFRHEVTRPTKFHDEFKEAFGRPVYEGLRKLLAMKVKDEERLELLTTSIWAQVSVYALADVKWHKSFRPAGVGNRAWAEKVTDSICESVFIATSAYAKASADKKNTKATKEEK